MTAVADQPYFADDDAENDDQATAQEFVDELAENRRQNYHCTYDDDTGKLEDLPTPIPEHSDLLGLHAWLSVAWPLNDAHPIVGVAKLGRRSGAAYNITRAGDVLPIVIDPSTRVCTPTKHFEMLNDQLLAIDGRVPAYNSNHCGQIAYVLRMAADSSRLMTEDQEILQVIDRFLDNAVPVHGTRRITSAAKRNGLRQEHSNASVTNATRR